MLVVFVHLGVNPSPCLNEMARNAKHHAPSAHIVLITDHPNVHPNFPGEIVKYIRQKHNPWFESFAKRRKELSEIAGGYWSHTLERLFALIAIEELLHNHTLVHIESDVYLNLEETTLNELTKNLSRVSIPRYSSDLGIASILIAKNRDILLNGLDELKRILLENNEINSDMNLLGTALNLGIFNELSSNPEKPIIIEDSTGRKRKFTFDAAALGQYFFGQDPFHTNGRRISGFLNPDAAFNSSNFRYSIRNSSQNNQDALFVNDVEILNLHVHSKLKLMPISELNETWKQSTLEANQEIFRKPDEFTPDLIHTQPISFLNRLRIAKRKGLIKSLIKASLRRLVKLLSPNE